MDPVDFTKADLAASKKLLAILEDGLAVMKSYGGDTVGLSIEERIEIMRRSLNGQDASAGCKHRRVDRHRQRMQHGGNRVETHGSNHGSE
jgi:hypothetical protein